LNKTGNSPLILENSAEVRILFDKNDVRSFPAKGEKDEKVRRSVGNWQLAKRRGEGAKEEEKLRN
jgi:hypothetical protein